ncbi:MULTISPECIES: phage tail assembly chaperone G [Bacillus]|uniref:Phage tail tape measure protein chaperone n=2 Tax=Bacillus subtilis TaxID=1423 RepID=S5DQ31_BACIU|nr:MULTISPECIES: hypothetical protein [Bacillus]AGQ21255.1 phage tail tape measure protein chaperone [Bacillus subtilis subsp. subtilis NCIB 3610 = ATCC 6051 = DSM 10]AQZ93168.1 hypothetical protein B4U62_22180 [Bacillus subtilis]KNB75945.1 hypothetical protein ACR57_21185 [Bacillus subtilis]MBA4562921.1 hypothetical protein [Bacillus subtilis subsp. subtilis]MBF8228401.1 hypothetical protein [Bacillus subtilis]
MLKIELYNPELDKVETFTEGFVSARALRRVIEFGVKQETEVMNELEQLDELVALVASLFRSEKVNFDTIYDGIASDKIAEVLSGILQDVLGGEAKKKKSQMELAKVTE